MSAPTGLAILDPAGTRNDPGKTGGSITTTLIGAAKESTPPLVAVAIDSNEDRSRLVALLRALHLNVAAHKGLGTLRRSLLRDKVDLVITDVTLPDGNWVDVLRAALQASPSPGILVHSRLINDRLWSEVLWRGAHDMLIAPFSSKDGCEIVESALRASCSSPTANLRP
jgi:DNA-binding NtrC family response regulator